MDSVKLILTEPVLPPTPLQAAVPSQINGASEQKKKQVAKDFESVLLGKLLDQMKNTIGHWSFNKDGASQQIQGLFWLYLAGEIANKGGFGLWKDIYQFLISSDQANTKQ